MPNLGNTMARKSGLKVLNELNCEASDWDNCSPWAEESGKKTWEIGCEERQYAMYNRDMFSRSDKSVEALWCANILRPNFHQHLAVISKSMFKSWKQLSPMWRVTPPLSYHHPHWLIQHHDNPSHAVSYYCVRWRISRSLHACTWKASHQYANTCESSRN